MTQYNNIRLESYIDMFQRPGLVRPGDSSGSVLAQVIRGRLPHPNVQTFADLTANQRQGIVQWIYEGAKNN
jgi:hypothetical protein